MKPCRRLRRKCHLDPRSGTAALRTHRFTVAAWETVTVRAGTFEAFRIVYVREHVRPVASAHNGAERRAMLWYSPAARSIVKRRALAPSGVDEELVSYSLQVREAGSGFSGAR